MVEALGSAFVGACMLGAIALLIGRFVGRQRKQLPVFLGPKVVLFLKVSSVAFLAQLAFAQIGLLLGLKEDAQRDLAEFLLPVIISSIYAHHELLRVTDQLAAPGSIPQRQGVKWVHFWLVAGVVLLVGSAANYRAAVQQDPPSDAHPTELLVISSSQSADGVTESDLTPQLASALEKYGAGRIAAKVEGVMKQAGSSPPPLQMKSESTVVEAQGKKLVVIRYEINGIARAVEVIGVSGTNLDRVMCTRSTLDEILLTIGPCAQKVKAVHGVSIAG